MPDARRLGGKRAARRSNCSRAAHPGRERASCSTALQPGIGRHPVGTHALITEEVGFSSLGVVVIDEQHRFGVDQRAALREKGSAAGADGPRPGPAGDDRDADPATAAMTVYGDLDYSVLDELPPGRTPVDDALGRRRLDEAEAW